MTDDEILQAAKDAGLTGLSLIDVGYLERFATIIENIVEKRTIERCESVLMQLHKKHRRNHNHFHYAALQVAAIRKLGEQE